jgi:hypothetical protein
VLEKSARTTAFEAELSESETVQTVVGLLIAVEVERAVLKEAAVGKR